jgi:voltage-gated potassium channel
MRLVIRFYGEAKCMKSRLTRSLGAIRFTREFAVLARKILVVAVVSLAVIGLQGIVLWLFDRGANDLIQHPLDGVYFMLVSIFGETTAPSTIGARVMTIIALLEGLVLGAYVVVVAAVFNLRGGGVFMKLFSNHIVICGWNTQGEKIIEGLLEASDDDIIVIPGDEKPESPCLRNKRVRVIDGDPTSDATLDEAGIDIARSAIILTDTKLPSDAADAKTLMVGLAVESKNPAVYTCAQVVDSASEVHLRRANVDEVVSMDHIGAQLSVASAVNPGVTQVINELVTFNEGSEFYRIEPPTELLGKLFSEAALLWLDQHVILIAVETSDVEHLPEDLTDTERRRLIDDIGRYGRAVLVNPERYAIASSDALFLIADKRPEFLV